MRINFSYIKLGCATTPSLHSPLPILVSSFSSSPVLFYPLIVRGLSPSLPFLPSFVSLPLLSSLYPSFPPAFLYSYLPWFFSPLLLSLIIVTWPLHSLIYLVSLSAFTPTSHFLSAFPSSSSSSWSSLLSFSPSLLHISPPPLLPLPHFHVFVFHTLCHVGSYTSSSGIARSQN